MVMVGLDHWAGEEPWDTSILLDHLGGGSRPSDQHPWGQSAKWSPLQIEQCRGGFCLMLPEFFLKVPWLATFVAVNMQLRVLGL